MGASIVVLITFCATFSSPLDPKSVRVPSSKCEVLKCKSILKEQTQERTSDPFAIIHSTKTALLMAKYPSRSPHLDQGTRAASKKQHIRLRRDDPLSGVANFADTLVVKPEPVRKFLENRHV